MDLIICYKDYTSGIWLIWTPMVIGGAQQQLVGIGSGTLPMSRWDSNIHLSDELFYMRLMTDQVEAMIGFHHGGHWKCCEGVVGFHFSLMIPRIKDSRGLKGIDFIEVPWLSMFHDRGF